ncbi:MAG: hypothetical protein KatS3mg035_1017 [Bacteroidia bacterium]|nr:MAG: hypothetical protein KatS3mg035_1017 [Bacteroidia bacterium]
MRKIFHLEIKITNFKAITNLDYMNKYQGSQKVSEWKSPIYSYIQKAKTTDEARNLFENKWNKLANYEPKPKLEILSVQEIGEISDKIHTY